MSEPVDTSKVFKELVHCFECDQPFYFTLWAIAENQNLACPQCGIEINVADHVYQSLLASVQERVAEISSFQCAPPGDRHLDRERASSRLGHHMNCSPSLDRPAGFFPAVSLRAGRAPLIGR
jgi:hypothetical protein